MYLLQYKYTDIRLNLQLLQCRSFLFLLFVLFGLLGFVVLGWNSVRIDKVICPLVRIDLLVEEIQHLHSGWFVDE